MLALLYDIHGNLPALEAVLADAEAAGADRWLLGGDYAMAGAWPAETVERLRELQEARWIRGNVDRWCAGQADDAPAVMQPLIEACVRLLGEDTSRELGSLPETAEDEGGAFYCHGSPKSDMESFFPQPGERDEELLTGVGGRRVVFGHTHLQFRREGPNGSELVNPGSVGIPCDGDHRAAYALVASDDSLELRRVAYDHQASADALRERLGEAGDIPARRIEQARFDV
jgi:predicted phosphodiesterase